MRHGDDKQRKASFLHNLQKKSFSFFVISIFLRIFANVNHVRSHRVKAKCWLTVCIAMQMPVEGGKSCLWEATWQWGTIYGLGVYLTLCSWHSEIWKISIIVKEHGSGRCPWVCIHQPAVYLIIYKVCQRCDIHTGVGFCVARSDDNGQSRASECGTSDGMSSHAFFVFGTIKQW